MQLFKNKRTNNYTTLVNQGEGEDVIIYPNKTIGVIPAGVYKNSCYIRFHSGGIILAGEIVTIKSATKPKVKAKAKAKEDK